MTSAVPVARGPRTSPQSRRWHAVTDSPVGPLTVVAIDGAVTGLFMDEQRHRPAQEMFGDPAGDPGCEPFAAAFSQLREYFEGQRTEFDLPLTLHGTEFQRRVWGALRAIPYGQTVSYGQLADRLGQPSASRAVGLANSKNPVSIIVPCHRVVGADGGLTGYGGGIERKRYLLAHELRISGQTLA